MSSETLAEMHERHAREIAAIEKPGAPTYSHLLDDVEILTGDVRRRDELIQALRTRLAESEAEVANQRRLRMMAEEAIPKGVEVARDYFAAEIQTLRARLAESEAEVAKLRAWQEAVADEMGYLNRVEGYARCEIAPAETVVDALKRDQVSLAAALAAPVEPAPRTVPEALSKERMDWAWQQGAEWMREQAALALPCEISASAPCSPDAAAPCESCACRRRMLRSLPVSPPAPDPFVPGEPTPALLRALASSVNASWCPRPHHLLLAGEKCPACGESPPAPEEAKP